jgi:hypothetical protein
MFTVQIARHTTTRFLDREFTGTAAECAGFVAENPDWTHVATVALTAEEVEKREIAREWRKAA